MNINYYIFLICCVNVANAAYIYNSSELMLATLDTIYKTGEFTIQLIQIIQIIFRIKPI